MPELLKKVAALWLVALVITPFTAPFSTLMKLIGSVVRPDKLEQVKAALERLHVVGMMVAEVHDHWPQDHGTTVWKGHEYKLGFSTKMAIELVVHDDDVQDVVKVIINSARTGHVGDGFVSVVPIEHRYNIRNGERDVS